MIRVLLESEIHGFMEPWVSFVLTFLCELCVRVLCVSERRSLASILEVVETTNLANPYAPG